MIDFELQSTFTQIYKNSVWGQGSGYGSTDEFIVNEYINSISIFLKSFDIKPKIVDLGCGDFNVGSKLVEHSLEYVACDIVEFIIEQNKNKYSNLNVKFQVLDISKDELPVGDIAIIRQVLQHLSNEKIKNIIEKLYNTYQYIIVTEHIPENNFISNVDISSGNETRIRLNSGIILTKDPFFLSIVNENVINLTRLGNTFLKTTVYQLH
jgi:hypothetical protein